MKKLITVAMVITLALGVLGMPVYADAERNNYVSSREQLEVQLQESQILKIANTEKTGILYDDGITKVKRDVFTHAIGKLEVITVTQLDSTTLYRDAGTVNKYITRAAGSYSMNDTDGAFTVRTTVTTGFDTKTMPDGISTIKLTYATTKCELLDKSFALKGYDGIMGQEGFAYTSSGQSDFFVQETKPFSRSSAVSGTSYKVNSGFSQYYNPLASANCNTRVTTYFQRTTGGTKYSFDVLCDLLQKSCVIVTFTERCLYE